MGFQRGAVDAKKASTERDSFGDGVKYFKLKEDGEKQVIMLVHDGDEWFHARTHAYLPTKTKDSDGKWKTMSAICQKDPGIGGDSCYACDDLHLVEPNPKTKNAKRVDNRGKYFANTRYYIPVVILDEVVATQEMIDSGEVPATMKLGNKTVDTLGRVIGRQPKTVEVDETDEDGKKTGKKVEQPDVQLWVFTWDQAGAALTNEWEMAESGTVCDRPFRVTRSGTGLDTQYLPSQLTPIEGLDLSDPATKKIYDIIDVEKFLIDQASAEFYERLFDRRVQNEGDDASTGGEGGGETNTPTEQLDDEQAKKLEAIKAGMNRKRQPAEV